MKRLGLLLLPCLLACDLKESEIGESGNAGDAEGGSESGSEGETSGDGQACTLIGCDDAAYVHLIYDSLESGTFEFQLLQSTDGERPGPENSIVAASCSFEVANEVIVETDCPIGPDVPEPDTFRDDPRDGILHIQFPIVPDAYWILHDPAVPFAIPDTFVIQYEDVYPNGPECGVGCSQGHWWMSFAHYEDPCEGFEAQFEVQAEAVRACDDASECGQVIEGTSCGCTRDWVARNDADLTFFNTIVDAAVGNECDFLPFESTCDCPEADGYACVDSVCAWNYL